MYSHFNGPAVAASIMMLVAASVSWAGSVAEPPVTKTISVPGTSDPFLAGQPSGTCCGGDSAPAESPVLAGFVRPRGKITFTQTSGGVNYTSSPPTDGPAGNLGYRISSGPSNGIGGYANAPVDALVGVFLPLTTPESHPVTTTLDFTTPTTTPALQQVFYIGNGGANFAVTVPAGAARLYLGTVDGTGWYNNSGAIKVTVSGLVECPLGVNCANQTY